MLSPVAGTGGPLLSSTRICSMARPLARSPAYSNCRSDGAWASRAPGPCRVPRTHPCAHAVLLHASIAPSHPSTAARCASEALARCSCPLAPPFLLEQPDCQTAHSRTSRATCPKAVNKSLCLFNNSSSRLCLHSVLSWSSVHVTFAHGRCRSYLPRANVSPVPAPVLLHT